MNDAQTNPGTSLMRRWGRWGAAAAVAIVAGVTLSTTVIDVPAAHADQIRDMQYWLSDYGFNDAWLTTKGAGVTVAVIDTGIDGSVAELKGAIVGGMDASGIGSQNGQKPVGDNSQHGTMVASLLAGRGRGPVPGSGVIGVAPEAEMLAVSVAFGTDTGSTISNDDQIAAGVRWAVDNGADVINMSLTRNTPDWPQSWDDAFLYAFEHDVVVVAAAGNRGAGTTAVGAPATIPGVLTVAGVDRNGEASFDASSQGITISVAAPSEDLVGVVPGGGYAKWDGTSGAAPIVSGLVALVRAAYPELNAAEVINRVVSTAVPRGAVQIYGNGLIDAAAAIDDEVAPASVDPTTQLKDWIHLHRRAAVAPSEEAPDSEEPIAVKADPPAPESDSFASVIPNSFTMATVVVPICVLAGFAILIVLLGIGATRHFRRLLRR